MKRRYYIQMYEELKIYKSRPKSGWYDISCILDEKDVENYKKAREKFLDLEDKFVKSLYKNEVRRKQHVK